MGYETYGFRFGVNMRVSVIFGNSQTKTLFVLDSSSCWGVLGVEWSGSLALECIVLKSPGVFLFSV